jgi:pyridoxine 4-dehydrogenase
LLSLPAMGLGAWAWGDSLFWGYDPKEDKELHKVFDYAVANSKNNAPVLFDTAELYGLGRSESLLGEFSKNVPADADSAKVIIASKFAALPFRSKAKDVVSACEGTVKRLGRPVDLYQIHFPNAWSNAEYWDGLAMAYEKGLVKAVGVSNYGVDAMRACHDALAKRGIPLTSNQIQLSLLYRWPLENGLVDACHDLGVQVLAYSPLALGFLTGKYNKDKLPSGPRQTLGKTLFETEDYNNLLQVMKEIADKHSGATVSQVALNWTRAKQTIPIPGARTLSQVQQNYGALDWTLSAEEEKRLDEIASKVTTFIAPDKSPFPKKDINTGMIMFDS